MQATLLLLATALAQPQTVTFTHTCDKAEVVLEALGKELGVEMKPSGSVHDDYFLVRFEGVPVQEALEKIATTLNATWSEKSGVRYLGRTRQQEIEDARAGQSYVGEEIKKWVKEREPKQEYTLEYAEGLLKQAIPLVNNPDGNQHEALRSLSDQSPLSRLITRIVGEIDIDELASIQMGESVQYATQPNASQRPLPQGDALKLFEQENATHRAALDKTGSIEQLGTYMMWSSLTAPYRFQNVETGRVKLTFVRDIGSIEIRLSVGRVSENQSIRITRPEGQGVPAELTNSTDEIQWPDINQQIVQVLQPMMTGRGGSIGVPEQLQEFFSDPVNNEFLSELGSSWIIDTAKKKNLNVVALLSDDAGFIGMIAAAQQIKEGQLWAMLPSLEASYDFTLKDGWLTFAPNRRAEVRAIRIDRELLKQAIALHKREQRVSIDSVAMLFSASDHELHSMIATLMGGLANNDAGMMVLGQTLNADTLRLYNQLSDTLKSQARQGGAVVNLPLSNKKFNYYASKIVFGDRSQLQPEARKKIWPDNDGYANLGPEGDTFDKLGDGFPRGSSVRFIVLERDLIFPQPIRQDSRPNGLTPEAFASRMVSSEFSPDQQRYLNFDRVFVSSAQRLVVEFNFPGLGYVYADAKIDRLPKQFDYKPLADLPPAMKQEVDEAIKNRREMYKNTRIENGRVIPPQD